MMTAVTHYSPEFAQTDAKITKRVRHMPASVPEPYTSRGSLHAQFDRQAKATPEAVAVVDEKGLSHSYHELDEESTDLAAFLVSKGLVRNGCAAIYMLRSYEYAVAYIGILKAGGAYLPLDITYPQQLIKDIIEEAKPVAIITAHGSAEQLPECLAKLVVSLEIDWLVRLRQAGLNTAGIPVEVELDDLAFIPYSSGTTGKPKGVMNMHRGAVFSYAWRHDTYPYEGEEHEACNVFFIWEMLRPLMKGQTLHIIPDDTIYDPKRLLTFLKERRITRMLFTPSLLEATLEVMEEDSSCFATMKQIWLCGEVVTTSLLRRCVKQIPHARLINLYSVSECHDVASCDLTQYYRHSPDDVASRKFCPVGEPLAEVELVILSDKMKVKQIGEAGEIYVGGPGLSKGYLNRPELDQFRFIEAPAPVHRPDMNRLYRTGDWGYLLAGGSLEICGRCDTMVKIRGYSVEVQAIEKCIMQLDYIKSCVVLAEGKEGEDKFLVAYIVQDGTASRKEIRAELKKRLPFYMIPSYFVFLSEMPILPASGKLDKKALPPLDKKEASVEAEFLPKTKTELRLSEVWKEVLDLSVIDIQESFFDLGGHSLLATRLLSKINAIFNLQLVVKDLFTYNNVSLMAKLIDKQTITAAELKVHINLIDEVNNMDQAKGLDIDMQLRAFWRHLHWNKERWSQCCVLLTGSTGYVGSHLLYELLLTTKNNVYCLIRERSSEERPADRIMKTFYHFKIVSEQDMTKKEELEIAIRDRVTVVCGDIGLEQLGQNEEDYTFLSTEIDCVVHAAAYVNLIYPYAALYTPNVLGTSNILLFAAKSKVKPIHYISTNAVFPHGMKHCAEDQTLSDVSPLLQDGYSQTKWVAEQLVQRAMDRGHPVVIYRLGNMAGNSRTGGWNPSDFNLLMISAIAHTGCAPAIDWSIEMTPVDWASRVIISIMKLLNLSAHKKFHIINQQSSLPLRDLVHWMNRNGYPTKFVDYKTWLERLAQSETFKEKDFTLRLLEGMAGSEEFFSNLSTFSNENLISFLRENSSLKYPAVDNSLLILYFTKLSSMNLIPKPKQMERMNQYPLVNRVAFITGSSSGIGQAIALRLAEAGCDVALVARTEEKLHQIVQAIEATQTNGRALAVPCDVTQRSAVKAAVALVEEKLGPINIVVNCAGVMYYHYVKDVPEKEWDQTVNVNINGVLNTVGAALPAMLQRGSGHIVNISSDAGFRPFPGLAAYCGSKYFVEGFSQAMRLELKDKGIRVTVIQPGDVSTPLQDMSSDPEAVAACANRDKAQMLEPDDVARGVLFVVTQPDHVGLNSLLIEPRTMCV